MSTIGLILVLLTSVFIYLFVLWKLLREDYISSTIFTVGFIAIGALFLGATLGLFLARGLTSTKTLFEPENLWLWTAFLSYTIAIVSLIKRFRLRFFETIEAAILGVIPVYALLLFYLSVLDKSIQLALYSLGVTAHILLFLYLMTRYKKFTWYKSGRVGFAGLTTGGVFFLVRSLVAISFPSMVSFIGKSDAIVSGALAFIFFFAVYNLSEA